ARGAGRQLRLGEGVDLSAVKIAGAPRVRIRGDVEAIGVGPNVRVVAEARARAAGVAGGAVVGHINAIDVPLPGWVGGLANREVQMVDVRKTAGGREGFQREHDYEEALGGRVVQARRVSDELSPDTGRAIDGRRVPVERVQVHRVVHVAR